MTASRQADGRYVVLGDDGATIAGPFDTNSEAWRWIDRQEDEPVSKSEAKTDAFLERMFKGPR